MSNVFLEDVLDQPRAMREAIQSYMGYGAELAKLAALKPRRALFTGMGSSHYCSQSAVIRLIGGGVDARVVAASEALYYELDALTAGALPVLTSQSGESGEIVDLIEFLISDKAGSITGCTYLIDGGRSCLTY